MYRRNNSVFILIIFMALWIMKPISYEEVLSRHPIYEKENQENIFLGNNSDISNQNQEFDFLFKNDKNVCLVSDCGSGGSSKGTEKVGVLVESFSQQPPLPRRSRMGYQHMSSMHTFLL